MGKADRTTEFAWLRCRTVLAAGCWLLAAGCWLGPVDPASLTTSTFSVHATATSPIPTGGQVVGYDLDRPVTEARLDRHGNIVLALSHAEGQPGGGTLGYLASKARNVRLDLVYTITQNTDCGRRDAE